MWYGGHGPAQVKAIQFWVVFKRQTKLICTRRGESGGRERQTLQCLAACKGWCEMFYPGIPNWIRPKEDALHMRPRIIKVFGQSFGASLTHAVGVQEDVLFDIIWHRYHGLDDLYTLYRIISDRLEVWHSTGLGFVLDDGQVWCVSIESLGVRGEGSTFVS